MRFSGTGGNRQTQEPDRVSIGANRASKRIVEATPGRILRGVEADNGIERAYLTGAILGVWANKEDSIVN
jgi:hypothetical protein